MNGATWNKHMKSLARSTSAAPSIAFHPLFISCPSEVSCSRDKLNLISTVRKIITVGLHGSSFQNPFFRIKWCEWANSCTLKFKYSNGIWLKTTSVKFFSWPSRRVVLSVMRQFSWLIKHPHFNTLSILKIRFGHEMCTNWTFPARSVVQSYPCLIFSLN